MRKKAIKIDMALVDEANRVLNSLKNDSSMYDEVIPKTIKILGDFRLLAPKAQDRFDTNKSIIKATNDKLGFGEKVIAQFEQQAKELGINVNEIAVYKEVMDAMAKLSKNQNSLERLNKLK